MSAAKAFLDDDTAESGPMCLFSIEMQSTPTLKPVEGAESPFTTLLLELINAENASLEAAAPLVALVCACFVGGKELHSAVPSSSGSGIVMFCCRLFRKNLETSSN